ncbi:MAG: hypothetical protein KVP17_004201 [Porospora cf. gigantea B]|uniref:uncharacterized protein n=1 Tax=Porospora cf. gigantea B TaxID=2853592 RepID=UPI003571AEFC|nr:MAG: hypothetical protein KVP17_004201 [Porospora cf. gigantea B]
MQDDTPSEEVESPQISTEPSADPVSSPDALTARHMLLFCLRSGAVAFWLGMAVVALVASQTIFANRTFFHLLEFGEFPQLEGPSNCPPVPECPAVEHLPASCPVAEHLPTSCPVAEHLPTSCPVAECTPPPRRGPLEDMSVAHGVIQVEAGGTTTSAYDFGSDVLIWHSTVGYNGFFTFNPETGAVTCIRDGLPSANNITPITILKAAEESTILWGLSEPTSVTVPGRVRVVGGDAFYFQQPETEYSVAADGTRFLYIGNGQEGFFHLNGEYPVQYDFGTGELEFAGVSKKPVHGPTSPIDPRAFLATALTVSEVDGKNECRVVIHPYVPVKGECSLKATEPVVFVMRLGALEDTSISTPQAFGLILMTDETGRRKEAEKTQGLSTILDL